jgi:uncharacterized membrane protein YdjX (TVP38/TMEM64 family)
MTPVRSRAPIIRAVLLVLVVGGLIALAQADTLHHALIGVLEASRGIIAAHPVAGPLAFLGLAALSAMLGFVSSAILVPAAVYAWGAVPTMLMLWVGWTIGGVTAYTLAYFFGRPALRWLVPGAVLSRYQSLLDKRPRFSSILLFQLALPSEIPGYLLGLAHYPLSRYLGALMLAELPYAIGTVLLGVGFVERDSLTLLAVCGVGAVALVVIAGALRRRRED